MGSDITINGDNWLFELMLDRPDKNGDIGTKYLKKKGIIPAAFGTLPDVYFAKEGHYSRNQKISLNRTVYVRIESPFILPDTYVPGITNGYMAVLTYGCFSEDSYHFNEPQDYSWFHKYFDCERNKLVCFLSRDRDSGDSKFKGIEQRSLRREIVASFDTNMGNKFHTYGRGWNNVGYKGFIMPYNEKFRIISEYNFNVAIEGERYNGRITEKIFQAMACGSIPIYKGPVDIDKYIPNDCYIDLRQNTLKEVSEIIMEMSDENIKAFKERIKSFLISEKANLFSSVEMAKVIERIIKERL